MDAMRVVHVPTRYPPGPGGVERHVREVAVRQRARGHDARVVCSDLLTEIPWQRVAPALRAERRTADGIPIHRHRAYALPGEMHYPFLPWLYPHLRRERPDVLHVHTYGTYQGFSGAALERLNGVPLVLTAHYHPTWSIWGGDKRKGLRRRYDRWLAPQVLRRVHRLVLQTPQEEALLREVVADLPPVRLIPPGYTPLAGPAPGSKGFAATFGVPGPFLLFVGRLASNKGIPTLVDAFARIAAAHPDLQLVLVGADGGEAGPARERARRHGLAPRVHLPGFVADEALLSAAYAEARAFVLPSTYEAFGLVLLEALAQGTPVVSTRVGGIPAIVEEGRNGHLVPPEDAGALAAALEDLLGDPARARAWGQAGRRETVPRFTWEHLVESLDEVYREVRSEARA